MSLYVDRHRPTTLASLSHSPVLTTHLYTLANSHSLPHILIYGPPGAGKKTRVTALLKEIFGNTIEKTSVSLKTFATPAGRKIECPITGSSVHIEMNPSDVGTQDRMVVQEIIKELAQTQQIDASAKRKFKVVVINEADALSRDAQSALRRTMEKYMGNLRIILIANNTSKLISPIRSRCLLIRVAAPPVDDIVSILNNIATHEKFLLPDELAIKIAQTANRNLRKAILMLEATKVHHQNLTPQTNVQISDWETYLHEIARNVVDQQSPERLLMIRGKFYELITHCIPPDVIIKYLAFNLITLVDGQLKTEIAYWASIFEHRLRLGNKAIYHLEAFVAKFMSIYKHFLVMFEVSDQN